MRLKSSLNHSFARTPRNETQRSSFNRSHGHKTTLNSGWLVPIYCDEALPGDTFNLRMTAFSRMATPIVPIMDNVYMDTFFFAVPIRLVWDNFRKFMGQQENPDDTIDFLVPQIETGNEAVEWYDLHSYMGIPTGVQNLKFNSLHARAYNLIWNEHFRDQNLQDSIEVPKDDGPDDMDTFVLKRRGKRHDYFTSALPFPQKGPDVPLPLGDQAPVTGIGLTNDSRAPTPANIWETDNEIPVYYEHAHVADGNNANEVYRGHIAVKGLGDSASRGIEVYADLSLATATTVNALRQAIAIQRFYEKDARGGTRYDEIIRSHFNVISPDSRLQRPEYLGGGSSPVQIHPVVQTSASENNATPQGNLSAFGTATARNQGFTKTFTEHMVIIGLISFRADYSYQEGLPRMFSRRTRFDFYWPTFAHLGEQEVLNKEIYTQGGNVTNESGDLVDDETWGYQERYAEYRYKPSQISGLFRSEVPAGTTSLDIWHLANDYSELPLLNGTFIEENPPIKRVIATQEEPEFILDTHFNLKCARPMPVFSVPGLMDHF